MKKLRFKPGAAEALTSAAPKATLAVFLPTLYAIVSTSHGIGAWP